MTLRGFKVAVLLAAAVGARGAWAIDTVKHADVKPTAGTVDGMTATEVSVQQGAISTKVPVNTIVWIQFENEPKDLTSARNAVAAGRLSDAVTLLTKIDMKLVRRKEIQQEVEFYRAMTAARLALGGSGSVSEAGKLLLTFDKANPESYHALEIAELIGDLFVLTAKYDNAQKYYAKVAAAPFPEYKMRGAVLSGRALLAQKQFAKAVVKFDEALNLGGNGKEAERQRSAAELGKVAAMAAGGKTDEAIKKVQELIAAAVKAESEDTEWYARAYNTLGKCLLKKDDKKDPELAMKNKKDAALAFLRVDVLYNGHPEQHAEALAHLANLWPEINDERKARQAQSTLKQRYPNLKVAQ